MKFFYILLLIITFFTIVYCQEGRPCVDDEMCKNGKCVIEYNQTSGDCQCDEKYAGKECDYKRKNKLVAFLLSILLGSLGADRFYLDYIELGVLKLLLPLFTCVGACIACCSVAGGSDTGMAIGSIIAIICNIVAGLAITIWWLVDWILILKDDLPDGNGYGLYNNF